VVSREGISVFGGDRASRSSTRCAPAYDRQLRARGKKHMPRMVRSRDPQVQGGAVAVCRSLLDGVQVNDISHVLELVSRVISPRADR
jgi:hypothetical protein